MNRRAALILFAAFSAVGCRRGAGPPDANYQKASAIYQQLYASQLDDAYGDPKMGEVVALLQRVDPDSQDAQFAAAMLGSIQRGRQDLAKSRAAREKMSAAAQLSASAPSVEIDPRKILAADAPDAGSTQDPYGPGALVSDINASNGGCLSSYEPFTEQATNVTGTVYRLVPGPTCANRLPGLAGQAVLVVSGRIYRRVTDPNPPGAQPPPAPGAGPPADAAAAAARPPAAPPAAAPADAGEAVYRYPGQPQPGATPPPAGQPQ